MDEQYYDEAMRTPRRYLCQLRRISADDYQQHLNVGEYFPFPATRNHHAERMNEQDVREYIEYTARYPERFEAYDVTEPKGIQVVERVPNSGDVRIFRILGINIGSMKLGGY